MPNPFGGFGGGGGGGAAAGVDSFEGRTGVVTSAEGDYTIAEMGDVTITSVATDQVLAYNGSAWVNTSVGVATNAQTGTSYTVLTGDRGKLVTHSNGSAIAVTLPQSDSAGFAAGWYYYTCSIGVGTTTITPTTSTINGAATLTLLTDQCALVVGDETNYRAMISSGGGANATLSVTRPNVTLTNSVATDQDFSSLYTIPANTLVLGTCISAKINFQWERGTSTATWITYLKLGATKVYTSGAVNPADGLTRGGMMEFLICGTAAAGASVAVDTMRTESYNNDNAQNNTAQPVSLATNGTLTIVPGVTFSGTGSTEVYRILNVIITLVRTP